MASCDINRSFTISRVMMVNRTASKRRIPIVIVNRGLTKGDSRATLKIDAGTSEVLDALADRLAG